MRIAIAISLGASIACAGGLHAQNLSTFGTPGLVDMPTAEVLPDGMLAFTSANFHNTNRNTLTFQMLPWVYGSFRYSYLQDFEFAPGLSRYDRSFDIHFQLRNESARAPALALGLRDFGGTGVYAGEYLAATKTFAGQVKVTGGIGWGRFAGRGAFGNPLSFLGKRFETRPASNAGGLSTTGQLDFGNWFRGDAALFGGVQWDVNERLSLVAEYSSDTYSEEVSRGVSRQETAFNAGVSYRFKNDVTLSGFYLHGNALGFRLSYVLDPREKGAPGGQEPAGPALQPPSTVALASWNLPPEQNAAAAGGTAAPRAEQVLAARLQQEGLRLVAYSLDGSTANVAVENNRYDASAQALGRTARVIANTLPPRVSGLNITLTRRGVPVTSVRTARADLYELEHDPDGAWKSFARSRIADAPLSLQGGTAAGAFPHFGYRFGPYLQFSFFDPDQPLRYETGAEFLFDYALLPGLNLSGQFRQPVAGNLDNAERTSDSVLPRVRSEWSIYAQESDFTVTNLTADYMWRPRQDVFAKVSGGYLEEMFAGISAEALWYPAGSRLALGAELAYAKQRDFDMLFGLQDYSIVTGHASLYYDLPGEYHLQVDAGRYLAGDWGTTIHLDREFGNGFKVGAFATATNVSSAEFGEGSFDKGIRFEVPLSWLTGRPSRTKLAQTIRPVLRDGGARINLRNRLYGTVRDDRSQQLYKQWGRYFR